MTLSGAVEVEHKGVKVGVAAFVAAKLIGEALKSFAGVGIVVGIMMLENFFDDLLLKNIELVLVCDPKFGIEIDL